MKTLASLVLLALVAGPAAADGRKVIVMPSDGRADAKVRQRIDTGVLKLARTLPDNVAPGEVSMADLAAALGCNAAEVACKDEVLSTLGADEVIAVTVAQKPQGFDVQLRRITKGGITRETSTLVTAERAEAVEGLAAVFVGGKPPGAPIGPAPKPAYPTTNPTNPANPTKPSPTNPAYPTNPANPPANPANPPTNPTGPAVTSTYPANPAHPADPYAPATDPVAPPPTTAPIVARPLATPGPHDDRNHSGRYYKIGMGVGGGAVLVGLLFWASASDLGEQIQAAPVRNKSDVADLKDLERRADDAARAGNVFVIGGLIVGGVSTYYYLKHKKARSTQARLLPAVSPGGAGLVFGGAW
ncbi:MAG: hypothetical protein KF773_04060 [Deltaproteobacteria bacterium]|nr:hypothetical protein [Deltaproteobacteria bacterium]